MFPSQVNVQPAPAVAGDFCDANPRYTVEAGPGGFVAGAAGLTVGRFSWPDAVNPNQLNNFGSGTPSGFVHRDQQGVITAFLAEASMLIPAGLQATLFNGGGFWAKNDGSVAATIGMKAYADFATGKVSFNAAATPPTGASVTGSVAANVVTGSIAVNSVTGSIAGTTLNVSAVGTGGLASGQVISGTGVDPNTTIVKQLTGTAGSTGTYQVSISQTVASTTIASTGGTLNATAVTTGTLAVGQTISGSGITAGTKITALLTGTGGTGKYAVDTAQTAGSTTVTASGGTLTVSAVGSGALAIGDVISGASVTTGSYVTGFLTGTGGAGTYLVSVGDTASSTTITVASGVETTWYAASTGAAGELVKMSSHKND